MPKKKPAKELTTEEVMKRLFPKRVRERLREIAEKDDKRNDSDSS